MGTHVEIDKERFFIGNGRGGKKGRPEKKGGTRWGGENNPI